MKRPFTYIIIGFWIVVMGIYFKREILPDLIPPPPPSYKTYFARPRQSEYIRMKILLRTVPVGTSETALLPRADGSYSLYNRTQAQLSILRHRVEVLAEAFILIDSKHSLKALKFTFHSPVFVVEAEGEVVGEELRLTITDGTETFESALPYPAHELVMTDLSPLVGISRLWPGQEWGTQIFNPLTMSFEQAKVKVEGKEEIVWQGEVVPAWVLDINYQNQRLSVWISEDGELLREETAYGVILVREESGKDEAALAEIREKVDRLWPAD